LRAVTSLLPLREDPSPLGSGAGDRGVAGIVGRRPLCPLRYYMWWLGCSWSIGQDVELSYGPRPRAKLPYLYCTPYSPVSEVSRLSSSPLEKAWERRDRYRPITARISRRHLCRCRKAHHGRQTDARHRPRWRQVDRARLVSVCLQQGAGKEKGEDRVSRIGHHKKQQKERQRDSGQWI
jgi:hypothetical protein